MPFCPSCKSEFTTGTSRCGDCNIDLVDQLDNSASDSEMIDIYAGYDEQQVQRVLDVLRGAGVEPLLRNRTSSAFPTNVGTTAQQLVAVAGTDAERSRALIQDAIKDGVVSPDGDLLGA